MDETAYQSMIVPLERARAEFVVSDSTSFQTPNAELPPHLKLITLKQVHGVQGLAVDEKSPNFTMKGDFLWTFERNLAVGVFVADCTAVLFRGQSRGKDFVCALHAGWRGTARGIFESFFKSLKPEGRLDVWMSPSISQMNYEVSDEVVKNLGSEVRQFCVESRPGHYYLDLKAYQIQLLRAKKLEPIFSSLCTYSQPEFFSYRQLNGELNARHLAWISL